MLVKQFDGVVLYRPHYHVRFGERFRNPGNGVGHFRVGELDVRLPFFGKPNRTVVEVA